VGCLVPALNISNRLYGFYGAVQEHGVCPLVKLLLTSSDRWEQRDAAFALMALQLDSQQLQGAAADILAATNAAMVQHQADHTAAATAAADDAVDSHVHDVAAPASRVAPAATPICSNTIADAGCSSGNSSGPNTAAAPSEHSNATTEAAAAAPAVASAGTLPAAELLASGVAAMHELLGRYRWCSLQYLQGQVGTSG
jgi:hypothetical protein